MSKDKEDKTSTFPELDPKEVTKRLEKEAKKGNLSTDVAEITHTLSQESLKELAKELEKEKGLKLVDEKGRSLTTGKFGKGNPGGPGRPKKVKTPEVTDLLTEEDRAAFLQDGKVHSKAALQRLLETAQTRAEAVKIASLLIQYDAPKLSAVETKSTEEKSISISWNISTSPQLPEPRTVRKDEKLVRSEETEKETNLIGAPEPDLKIVDGDCLTLTELKTKSAQELREARPSPGPSEGESE